MKAILTEGIGGYEKLKYCEVDVPKISSDEVLLRVLAAGINNTDINTRIGWYDTQVDTDTRSLTRSKQKKVTSQNFALSGEPFVLGGCPFQGLLYS